VACASCAVIHAVKLEGFIDRSEKAPEKTMEVEKDSKRLVVLNTSCGVYVTNMCSHIW
jgi:hypothetical protein